MHPSEHTAQPDEGDGAPFPHETGTATRYLSGIVWSGCNSAFSVLLPFVLFVFFARSMKPADVGMAAVAVSICELLKSMGLPGIYEALLQQTSNLRRYDQTASAALLCAGLVLLPVYGAALLCASTVLHGLLAHFALYAFLGLRIPLDLISLQSLAVLARRLSYRRMALRVMAANLSAGVLGVALSFCTFPLMGLIVYQVAQSVVLCAATIVGPGLLAAPRFHRDCFRNLRREAVFATGNRVLAASVNNLDQVALGAVVGAGGIAYYNLGKRLETTFVTVANTFSSGLFQPLFARPDAVGRTSAMHRALSVLTIVCGIPAATVAANAPAVVDLLFGRAWEKGSSLVALLAVNGFVRAIGMVPGALLSVSGHNRRLLTTSIVSAASGIVLVLALAPISLELCGAAMVAKNTLIVAWMAWLVRAGVQDASAMYLTEVAAPALAMLGMAELVARQVPILTHTPWLAEMVPVAAAGCASALVGCIFVARHLHAPARMPYIVRRVCRG